MASIKPKIGVEYADDATIVTLADEKILAEEDIKALQDAILPLVEQAESINLVIDFRNVRFLSSAVLGLLIRISKKVYEQDGRLRLCGINQKIYEIFKVTRLTKIFDIYKDLESTLNGLTRSD